MKTTFKDRTSQVTEDLRKKVTAKWIAVPLDASDTCFVQLSEQYTKWTAVIADYIEVKQNNFFPISYAPVLTDQVQELYYLMYVENTRR